MPRREPKIYATLSKRFCLEELRRLGFKIARDGGGMAKYGAGRTLLATASSLDGAFWRVTPLVRAWR
jgi:hypothetical protein